MTSHPSQTNRRSRYEHPVRRTTPSIAVFWTSRTQKYQLLVKRNPELKDPARIAAVQEIAVNYLERDLKIPRERLVQLWNTDPLFRSVEAQQMILDAARWRQAQAKAASAQRVMPPKPQSAGTGNAARKSNGAVDLAKAAAAGNMSEYARLRNAGAR